MGPPAISSSNASSITPTPEEEAAGASLLERPQSSSAPPATQAPPPPPAVKKLVDAHPSASAALPPKKDWCGSVGTEFVPDGALGVDWSDACKTHDECYATPDANKFLCDFTLQEDMSLACAAQDGGILCQVFAEAYFHGVQTFGGPAYDRAQEAAKAKGP